MVFRFYTNAVSRASRGIAAGIFVVGLLLMGFGVIIVALPEFFAYLAAMVFFVAGLGCGITAVKIFWAQRKLDKLGRDDLSGGYRRGVQIKVEDEEEF